ncbi:PQQ-dependent sugar dehydrogenase [Marinilongibacter aquaticus]|uniref:PQQ-dependent sugar dehydrogenase n=1 Tax=Marinilongibacter aquaticus TaxID=2975157 RepID=UPI0021BDA00D|nr:PQQ-dependent sugar dehydrogenase [Marinilongibacter aquaticus]UBM57466.1 PQQ-dependent sugar dehydrogenase [Marinilongibacter aquaticus]
MKFIRISTSFLFLFFSALWLRAQDTKSVDAGRKLFANYCGSCHHFRVDGIGPSLGGIHKAVKREWIAEFIKSPKAKIDAGDKRAKALFDSYKVVMPDFNYLKADELNALLDYIQVESVKSSGVKKVAIESGAVEDPIPVPIPMSELVVNIAPYTQIPFSSEQSPRTRICKMDFHPITKENYIVDLNGVMYRIHDQKPEAYLNMAEFFPNFINKPGLATGFGSFAFHPEFEKNGLLYTTHTEAFGSAPADFAYVDSIQNDKAHAPRQLQWVVTEWKTDNTLAVPFQGWHRELFRVDFVSQIHGAQELTFNPLAKPGDEDYGLLYLGLGDGGAVEAGFPGIPHNLDHAWGNVFRFDPRGNNSKNGHYGIPSSNPFAGKGHVGEIYARGFRNPHRISWTKSGDMIVSNIGQRQIETLNLVKKGDDFGWPEREGTFKIYKNSDINYVYPLSENELKEGKYKLPLAQFDHGEANAISGGFEYWGEAIPELKGKYLFGTIVKGRLFYIDLKDIENGKLAEIKEWQVRLNGKVQSLREITKNSRVDLRLGRDKDGEMYIFTKPDGMVYKLVK